MTMSKQWYIVHTYSGFEKKVTESLEQRAKAYGLEDQIGEIEIPTEEVVEMKAGARSRRHTFFPGYILVEIDQDRRKKIRRDLAPGQEHAQGDGLRRAPATAGAALPGGGRPDLQPGQGVDREAEAEVHVRAGESVRIIDGPFSNFQGVVEEVNLDRNTLKVMVTIFGRSTPVELDFLQVEKT